MRGHASLESLPIFVKAGFIVRTRADDSTTEAGGIEHTRFEKALASGAQYISTDYPTPSLDFSPYVIALPTYAPARRNSLR